MFAAACALSITTAFAGGCAPQPRPAAEPNHSQGAATPVKLRVLGIGGFFFRARDPDALARWYEEHLGVAQVPASYDQQPWVQEAGPTAFVPFAQKTTYFGRPEQSWMLNFRVAHLDAMVQQLRGEGVAVEVDAETYPNGRFARLVDPEGNPIQLWEAVTPKK
jgi:predicted enzyme related to lactoylglutathione lyase